MAAVITDLTKASASGIGATVLHTVVAVLAPGVLAPGVAVARVTGSACGVAEAVEAEGSLSQSNEGP